MKTVAANNGGYFSEEPAIARDSTRNRILHALDMGSVRLPSAAPMIPGGSQLLSDLAHLRPFRELMQLLYPGSSFFVEDTPSNYGVMHLAYHPNRSTTTCDAQLPWECLERYGEIAHALSSTQQRSQLADSVFLSLFITSYTEVCTGELYSQLIAILDLKRALLDKEVGTVPFAEPWLKLIDQCSLLLFHFAQRAMTLDPDCASYRPEHFTDTLMKFAQTYTSHAKVVAELLTKASQTEQLKALIERGEQLSAAYFANQDSFEGGDLSIENYSERRRASGFFESALSALTNEELWNYPIEAVARLIGGISHLVVAKAPGIDESVVSKLAEICGKSGHLQVAVRAPELLAPLCGQTPPTVLSQQPGQIQNAVNSYLSGRLTMRDLKELIGADTAVNPGEIEESLTQIQYIRSISESKALTISLLFDYDELNQAQPSSSKAEPTVRSSITIVTDPRTIKSEVVNLQVRADEQGLAPQSPYILQIKRLQEPDVALFDLNDPAYTIQCGIYDALVQMVEREFGEQCIGISLPHFRRCLEGAAKNNPMGVEPEKFVSEGMIAVSRYSSEGVVILVLTGEEGWQEQPFNSSIGSRTM